MQRYGQVTGETWVESHKFAVKFSPAAVAMVGERIVVCDDGSPGKIHFYDSSGNEEMVLKSPKRTDIWDMAYQDGKLYFTEGQTTDGHVLVCSTSGQHLDSMPVGYQGPGGIALSGREMFVTSSGENRVYRLKTNGANKQIFVQQTAWANISHERKMAGTANGLNEPEFVATNGRYVAVGSRKHHRISVFNMEGDLLYNYGRYDESSRFGGHSFIGFIQMPCGMVIDANNQVIACSFGLGRIHFVSAEGEDTQEPIICQPPTPRSLTLARSNQIIVVGSTYDYPKKFPAGEVKIYTKQTL